MGTVCFTATIPPAARGYARSFSAIHTATLPIMRAAEPVPPEAEVEMTAVPEGGLVGRFERRRRRIAVRT
jgi:hypothetical protein